MLQTFTSTTTTARYLVEEKSQLDVDEQVISPNHKNVKKLLYGEAN